MLGQIMEWFYHDLAGIGTDPAAPGFKNVIIKPQPAGDVTWTRASYESPRGRIVSDWKRREGQFTLEVTLPPNTTATVWVPGKGAALVRPAGKEATQWVKMLREEADATIFAIESGHYRFQCKY
jgi:alpha-L-rhamnosidase